MPAAIATIRKSQVSSPKIGDMINMASAWGLFLSYKLSLVTFGIAFVLPFIYTVILDIWRQGFTPKDDEILADPVESVVPRISGAVEAIPKDIRYTARLLGRVFVIYPVGIVSLFAWLAVIALIYWAYQALTSPFSTFAKLLFD